MDNKLSELSKPVAYMTAEGVAITHLDFESGSWGMHNAAKSDDMWCPLYSQEYVSALLAHIAELERILDGVTPVMIAGGWTAKGISDYAKSLEAKLATPVRLSCETHPRCRTQHAKDVRAAGFTVEGDE